MSTDDALSKSMTGLRPKWDGKQATYVAYEQAMTFFLMSCQKGWVIDDVREFCGEPEPNDEAVKITGRVRVFGMLAMSVPMAELSQIRHDQDFVQEDGTPDKDHVQYIGNDPNKLWKAFREHAKGAVSEMAGPELHADFHNLSWDSSGATFLEQVVIAIAAVRKLRARAISIADDNYPLTETMLVQKLTWLLPPKFQGEFTAYQSINKLFALEARLKMDAIRFDKLEQSTHKSMVTRNEVEQLQDQIKTLSAQVKAKGNGNNRNYGNNRKNGWIDYTYESKGRRMDFAAGPKEGSGDTWCDVHGWGNHDNQTCFGQKQRSGQQQQRHSDGGQQKKKVYTMDDDGKMTLVTNIAGVRNCFASPCRIVDEIRVALLSNHGVNTKDKVYVDSASDISWCKQLDSIVEARKLEYFEAPTVDGTNDGGPITATHVGYRLLTISGVQYKIKTFYAPQFKYDIVSTHDLQEADVGVISPAKSEGGGMFLDVHGTKTACLSVGHIWILPSHVQPTVKSLATKASYSQFRKAFGNMPHDKVVSLAKAAGVVLENANKHRANLDIQHRQANQRAQHAVAVNDSRFSNKSGTRIVMDHIGSTFPRSIDGHKGCLTICDIDDPNGAYYVYPAKSMTAEETWTHVKTFFRETQQHVVLKDAINQNITIYSDGAGCFTSAYFVSQCHAAGIQTSVSTPHKHNAGKQRREACALSIPNE